MRRHMMSERFGVSILVAVAVAAVGCLGQPSEGETSAEDTESALDGSCAGVPAWAAGVTYTAGALVQHEGKAYECIQGHTSLSNWTPNVVAALFRELTVCGAPGPNPNPGPTPDPGPGPQPEPEPEPEPEPDPGPDPGAASYSGYSSYNIYDGIPATSVKCNLSPQAYGMQVTAIRRDFFQAQGIDVLCNKCVRVTSKPYGGGYGTTAVARIIDESNDFGNNGGNRFLDLAPQVFQQIGNTDAGAIPVEFQIIDCPAHLD